MRISFCLKVTKEKWMILGFEPHQAHRTQRNLLCPICLCGILKISFQKKRTNRKCTNSV